MAFCLRSFLRVKKSSFRQSLSCLPALRHIQTGNVNLVELDKDFQAAVAKVKTLKQDPGNDSKLQLYGLFKQASVGKCNDPKPGAFDFVGKAKWTTWNDLGDMSKNDARQKYIDYVNQLVVQFGSTDEESNVATTGNSEKATASAESKYKELVVSVENGVQTIRMNRPSKYNAITLEMYEEFMMALDEAGKNDACVVAMVTGTGDYYCSGNDLSNFARIPPEGPQKMAQDARAILKKFVAHFIDFPKPLIAAVNGPAVGISVTVMGLFDLVYASDKATFHTPFMELGQSPEGCSSFLFPRIMGPAKANEMLLAGRKLTALEAHHCGLVTEVVSHNKFSEEIQNRVQALAKLPPKSLRLSKQLIRDSFRDLLHDTNEKEAALLEERWLSEECMQAIMNFMARKSK
ncbi:enoyl-CoA delta isomerase 2-like [Montipora foliosa]|uniref:enoyl-CoA delta isomerase 2-like n=1 Tax=Montipora foliosa TaxID=591990 RepID=UPI0035F13173